MNNEPVVNAAVVGSVVVAALAVLVAFGVPLSPDQQTAVIALVGVVAPVVVALFARREVTPLGTDRRGPDGANPDEINSRP